MYGAGHDGVAVHPEQGPVLGHVPHKQLAVGQPVLGDDPCHHGVRHLHVTQTPARILQPGQGGLVQTGRLYDDQPQVGKGVSGVPGFLQACLSDNKCFSNITYPQGCRESGPQ